MSLAHNFEKSGISLAEDYKNFDFSGLNVSETLAGFLEKYDRFPVIAITGPAGSGKTTVTKIIADFYNAKIYRELPELSPFLPLIGQTKDKIKDTLWFPNQSLFLSQDSAIVVDSFMNAKKSPIVLDFAITQTKAFGDLKLSGKEKDNFMNMFNNIFYGENGGFGGLPKPDLTIEIKSSDEIIIKRREQRGKRIDGTFVDEVGKMNELYSSGFVENHYENVIPFDNTTNCSHDDLVLKVHNFLQKISK